VAVTPRLIFYKARRPVE